MYENNLTDICRIGIVKRSGEDLFCLSKKITLHQKPVFASIKLDAIGVCGIFVNGEFLEASTGRFCQRITYSEFTSLLKEGENEIALKIGGHYYQRVGVAIAQDRGAMISSAAAEIIIETEQGITRVVTDESWECSSDDGQTKPQNFCEISTAEYNRYWVAANLWREHKPVDAPEAIKAFAGQEYTDYLKNSYQKYVYPKKVLKTNMRRLENNMLNSEKPVLDAICDYSEEYLPFAVFDFGRLHVGYVELEYEASADGVIKMDFDYSENVDDVGDTPRYQWHQDNLAITEKIQKGRHTLKLTRRRAFHFMRIKVKTAESSIKIISLRLLNDLKAPTQLGWFNCSEALLNKMWEVGKYTLYVNMHQEYESCPRNEMKFFSGDGVIDALTDYYTFGDGTLVDASLSLDDQHDNMGIVYNRNSRNLGLWDYPAWRIITVYNHYKFYKDIDLVKRYFDELCGCLIWMIDKMNKRNLIYQYPIFGGNNYFTSGSVEYNCSCDRLGEKPLLNALLYQSLKTMSEMGELVGDSRAEEWLELSKKVKEAIDTYLWSEEKGAYLDAYDRSYIPGDGNALMLLFQIPDKDRAQRVMRTLENTTWSPYGSAILSEKVPYIKGGYDVISPVMCAYEAEGRFLYGDSDSGLELVRRCWGTMIKKGAETMWEFQNNNGTGIWPIPAHAWSSGCTYLLSEYVGGIRPLNDGYEKLLFAPYGKMDYFTCVVPTPKGMVAAKCSTADGKKTFELCLPRGLEYEARIPDGATLKVVEY